MNYPLMDAYGDIGINSFAIISYLSSFTMVVFFGASEGMQPMFGAVDLLIVGQFVFKFFFTEMLYNA